MQKIKCEECNSETLVLFRGESHGLSKKDLTKAKQQIKSGKIYGYRCINCGYTKRLNKPIKR